MMGEQSKSEALFYYFKLEDHVPRNHLLRLIHRTVDFGFLRERLRPLYSETGRPSVDPADLLRMLLIGYLMASPASGVSMTENWTNGSANPLKSR